MDGHINDRVNGVIDRDHVNDNDNDHDNDLEKDVVNTRASLHGDACRPDLAGVRGMRSRAAATAAADMRIDGRGLRTRRARRAEPRRHGHCGLYRQCGKCRHCRSQLRASRTRGSAHSRHGLVPTELSTAPGAPAQDTDGTPGTLP